VQLSEWFAWRGLFLGLTKSTDWMMGWSFFVQRFIMILSEHLSQCEREGRDYNTPRYKWILERLQQVFLQVCDNSRLSLRTLCPNKGSHCPPHLSTLWTGTSRVQQWCHHLYPPGSSVEWLFIDNVSFDSSLQQRCLSLMWKHSNKQFNNINNNKTEELTLLGPCYLKWSSLLFVLSCPTYV